MLRTMQGKKGSFCIDVMLQSSRGKFVGGERRDVTDYSGGKWAVRERCDVTDSARGKWVVQ